MKVLFSLLLIAISASGFSQKDKFGATPEDSVNCVRNLSLYTEFFKQDNYKDAYNSWKKALTICPKYSKSLYINGDKMLKDRFEKETDATKKAVLLDSIAMLYDMRIQNFGQEGYVRGRKGSLLLQLDDENPKRAFDELSKSFELEGNEMEAGAVISLFKATIVMINKKEYTKSQSLEWYPKLAEITDHNLSIAKNEKEKQRWESVSSSLDQLVSKVADCEQLVEIFGPQFEANPKDQTLLNTILKLLTRNECTDGDLYLKAAKAQCEIEPKFNCSFAIGFKMVQADNCKEAVDYFHKASELAENDADKYKSLEKASLCLLKIGSYSNSRNYARKMLEVNPKSGDAYVIIAQGYAAGSTACGSNDCDNKAGYWAAVDKLYTAKSVDPEVAEKANDLIGKYSAQFPDKEKCFFHNITEGSTITVGGWIGESTKVRFKQ